MIIFRDNFSDNFSYRLQVHLVYSEGLLMPIRRGRNAPVTLTLSSLMFDWIASLHHEAGSI